MLNFANASKGFVAFGGGVSEVRERILDYARDLDEESQAHALALHNEFVRACTGCDAHWETFTAS